MKTNYLLLFTVIFSGCGIKPFDDLIKKKGPSTDRHTTDPAFYKYVDILKANGISTNTPVIFSKREDGVAGTCTKWTDGYKEIQIDPTYWNSLAGGQESYRMQLLAHEFAHCDYGLEHDDREVDSNSPCYSDSIMKSYNFGGTCFYDSVTESISNYYLSIF